MDRSKARSSALNPLALSFVPYTRPQVFDSNWNKNGNQARKKIKVVDENENESSINKPVSSSNSLLPVVNERLFHGFTFLNPSKIRSTDAFFRILFSSKISGIWKQPAGFALEPTKPYRLLISFFGLNNFEKAARPTVVITCRPERFIDKIWSVKPHDLTRWYPQTRLCGCPPILGYHIPTDFFGNPFNQISSCKENTLHITQYSEQLCQFTHNAASVRESSDFEEHIFYDDKIKTTCNENAKVHYDLKLLAKELKSIISVVCNLINEWDSGEHLKLTTLPDCTAQSEERADDLGLRQMCGSLCKNSISAEEYTKRFHELYQRETSGFEANGDCMFNEFSSIKNYSEERLPNEHLRSSWCNTPCSAWCKSQIIKEQSDRNHNSKFVPSDSIRQSKISESFTDSFGKARKGNCWMWDDLNKKMKQEPLTLLHVRKYEKSMARESTLSYTWKFDESQRRQSYGCDSGFSEISSDEKCSSLDQFKDKAQNQWSNMKDDNFSINSVWSPFDDAGSLWQEMPECIPSEKARQNKWNSLQQGKLGSLLTN